MNDTEKIQRALKSSQHGFFAVSYGTLHNYDLFHAFRDALKRYAPNYYLSIHGPLFYDIPKKAKYDDKHPFWDTEKADDVIDDMFSGLDGISPKGYRFGARPDAETCFGWWPAISDDVIQLCPSVVRKKNF